MANAAKRKGTAHETAIVNYLTANGISARRVVQTGRYDQGDIHADPSVCIEAKNVAKIDLADFVRQANREAVNAGRKFGTAIIKKRNANISQAYCVMDLETFTRILHALKGE